MTISPNRIRYLDKENKVLVQDFSDLSVNVPITNVETPMTIEAMDAEMGLTLMREHQPELVFLDIVLPGMNGFAALRAIRRDPQLRDVPVIMMSGNEQAVEQFFGTRIGADDFMKKPFSRYEIFFRIERLLDQNLVPRRSAGDSDGFTVALHWIASPISLSGGQSRG